MHMEGLKWYKQYNRRCVCVTFDVWACVCESLLMCTLHPWALWAPLFVRAVVVGLPPSPGSGRGPPLVILQVDLLGVRGDYRNLGTSREQVLQLLQTHRQ